MKHDHHWLEDPRNVQRIVFGVYTICGLLLLSDFLYAKSPHFWFESLFGFYPVFGFVVSFTLVLTAKRLRRLLRRNEDYYEPHEWAGPDD